MSTNRPDAQHLAAWLAYLNGHTILMRTLEQELEAAHQLSLAEYDVLVKLQQAPEQRLRMGELAEAMLFSSGGLSRLLDRLERRGMVARARITTDRRGVFASLTDSGRERLHQASATHLRGVQRHFAALLPEEELPAVTCFLTRLATHPTAAADRPPPEIPPGA